LASVVTWKKLESEEHGVNVSHSDRLVFFGAAGESHRAQTIAARQHPRMHCCEQAVKGFCVTRVPRLQEIFNDCDGRRTLSRARSSEKHRHEQRDNDLEY
jgi:hypothetical protein